MYSNIFPSELTYMQSQQIKFHIFLNHIFNYYAFSQFSINMD